MDALLDRQSRLLEGMPHLKSVIVVATPYSSSRQAPTAVSSGRIARYAWGRDYHKVIQQRLRRLEAFIRQRSNSPVQLLRSVDKGPFPERVLAEAAGLGFFGKNSCLIRPKFGSFFLLGLLLTDLELAPDEPIHWDCGSCTLCLQACPTQALVRPYELDARRCIAYLTIEHRGETPEDLRPKMGDWLFGCDICQEVCPYNAREAGAWPEFSSSAGGVAGGFLPLQEILAIHTEEAFCKRFSGTPLMRAKREGLLRNACVVAGNLQDLHLVPSLQEVYLQDSSELVRQHAALALEQIQTADMA